MAHAGRRRDRLHRLSQREFQIFRQIAEGRSVREIAEGLCLSGRTVSNPCAQIRGKLGLRSPAEIAPLAIRAGVLQVRAGGGNGRVAA